MSLRRRALDLTVLVLAGAVVVDRVGAPEVVERVDDDGAVERVVVWRDARAQRIGKISPGDVVTLRRPHGADRGTVTVQVVEASWRASERGEGGMDLGGRCALGGASRWRARGDDGRAVGVVPMGAVRVVLRYVLWPPGAIGTIEREGGWEEEV